MNFLDIIKHLLPSGVAFKITIEKSLRRFFLGFSMIGDHVKLFVDTIFLDLFPNSTRSLDLWENQFGVQKGNLTESQRRNRLEGLFKALGGQDISYLQNTLRNAGFDVYVHPSYIPSALLPAGQKGIVSRHNPLLYLKNSEDALFSGTNAGEALMQAGEEFSISGNRLSVFGYPLVNKDFTHHPYNVAMAGEASMQAGEQDAQAGNFLSLFSFRKEYELPSDPNQWAFFVYICGEIFGSLGSVASARKEEFENLCLKIFPAHLWVGVIVNYN